MAVLETGLRVISLADAFRGIFIASEKRSYMKNGAMHHIKNLLVSAMKNGRFYTSFFFFREFFSFGMYFE